MAAALISAVAVVVGGPIVTLDLIVVVAVAVADPTKVGSDIAIS